jgi:hypothetical protein
MQMSGLTPTLVAYAGRLPQQAAFVNICAHDDT